MHLDSTTEAIAHFIGLFSQTVEEVRMRMDYVEFDPLEERAPEQNELLNININIISPYLLKDYSPRVEYTPPPTDQFREKVVSAVAHNPMALDAQSGGFGGAGPSTDAIAFRTGAEAPAFPEYQPLGSLAWYVKQEARLEDNDYLSIGDHGLVMSQVGDPGAALAALIGAASEFQPFSHLDEPGSAEEIGDFIMHAPHLADAFADDLPDGADIFIARSEALEGQYVNGEAVEETPLLEDHLPDGLKANASEDDDAETDFSLHAKIEVEAGGNLLVNEAILVNDWYGAPVLAVAGDYVHFNTISQLNVWSDSDAVGGALEGWQSLTAQPTKAFNIATMQTIDNPRPETAGNGEGEPDFPSHWLVSRIDGDLVLANWVKQVSFVEDNDITVMSATGGGTVIELGGNLTVNVASLAELGIYYDLIIIGGNIYNANIISQTNILLDDDLVGTLEGFETSGPASLSTSGNLLWNEASITQYGTMSFEALPPSYLEAANQLEAGPGAAPGALLASEDFSGMANLKVLYISGDVVDLQYISQTNVLGDADQVALAKAGAEANVDGDWSVSTGGNALVNQAAITDGGVNATTYAGGNVYSDELLIQAELISDDTGLYTQSGDALVNEAVAFLSDDLMAPEQDGGHSAPDAATPDAGSADVMQTILG